MSQATRYLPPRARGVTMFELIISLTLLGVLVMVLMPLFGGSSDDAKIQGCHVNKSNVEVQAGLWLRNKGSWPKADLSDIFADTAYFPDGQVVCPVDQSSYSFDPATEKVVGHTH